MLAVHRQYFRQRLMLGSANVRFTTCESVMFYALYCNCIEHRPRCFLADVKFVYMFND